METTDPGGNTPPEESPALSPPPAAPDERPAGGQSLTDGGYAYSVVDDSLAPAHPGQIARAPGGAVHPLLLVALAVVPAMLVGLAVWFLASSGGSDDSARTNANVSNVINAFSQGQQGTLVRRFEGELPPGYPDDLPAYPGAGIVASIAQISGQDVGYLVIFDTTDGRDDVASYFREKFAEDPWQIDAGSDDADSALVSFSKIDDADISGIVLSAESKDDDLTTVVLSIQIVSGAPDDGGEPFTPGVTKPFPSGFPEEVPPYPDAIVIESAFRREAQGESFVVSFITEDDPSSVLQFYRDQLDEIGWEVADEDASDSGLQDAEAISFSADDDAITGGVVTSEFADDANYTRVDLQVTSTQ